MYDFVPIAVETTWTWGKDGTKESVREFGHRLRDRAVIHALESQASFRADLFKSFFLLKITEPVVLLLSM